MWYTLKEHQPDFHRRCLFYDDQTGKEFISIYDGTQIATYWRYEK
jgi:hypothetical protein